MMLKNVLKAMKNEQILYFTLLLVVLSYLFVSHWFIDVITEIILPRIAVQEKYDEIYTPNMIGDMYQGNLYQENEGTPCMYVGGIPHNEQGTNK